MLVLPTNMPAITHLVLAPQGRLLAALGYGQPVVSLWHLPAGKPAPSLPITTSFTTFIRRETGVHFSADGSRLLLGGWDECLLFDLRSGECLAWGCPEWGGLRGTSLDGRFLVLLAGVGGELVLRLIRADPLDHPEEVWRVPQPNKASYESAVASNGLAVTWRYPGPHLVRWNLKGQVVGQTAKPESSWPLAFTPGDRYFLTRNRRSVFIWDTTNWNAKPKRVSSNTAQRINDVAMHPAGRHVFLASNDGSVKVGCLEQRKIVQAYQWDRGPVTAVAISPEGQLAAAACGGEVVVWDLDL